MFSPYKRNGNYVVIEVLTNPTVVVIILQHISIKSTGCTPKIYTILWVN